MHFGRGFKQNFSKIFRPQTCSFRDAGEQSVASDVPKLHRVRHVATALTRARKARFPSPWTGRWILEEGRETRLFVVHPILASAPRRRVAFTEGHTLRCGIGL